ncbi:MAG: hypothetical protein WCQ95_01675 [Bacteroidota bacterium]
MEAHSTTHDYQDPQTMAYNDLINAGNDFIKIELYLYAIKKFKEALLVKPYDKFAKEQIYTCKAKLRKDNIKIGIIAVVVIVLVAAVLFF